VTDSDYDSAMPHADSDGPLRSTAGPEHRDKLRPQFKFIFGPDAPGRAAARHSLSIFPAGRGFAAARAGPRAESLDSAFIIGKPVTRRAQAFPSNLNVIAWRESRDRAQLSRSREEQGDLFIFLQGHSESRPHP
jgi:hypothetical protein